METNTQSDVNTTNTPKPKLNISKKKVILYSILFFLALSISIVVGYLTTYNLSSKTQPNFLTPPILNGEIPTETKKVTFIEEPPFVLDESAKGKIRIEQYYDTSTSSDSIPESRILFLFDNEKDNTTYSLTENLYRFPDEDLWRYKELKEPLLINNDIYFLLGTYMSYPHAVIGMAESNPFAYLMKFSIETGKISIIDLNLKKDHYISSFYIHDDIVYYLTHNPGDPPIVNLNSYNFVTKETKNLANEFQSNQIVGMNSDKDKLYLQWHWDGSGKFEEYDLTTGELSYLGQAGWVFDAGVEKTQEQIEDEKEFVNFLQLTSGTHFIQYLIIENQTIRIPTERITEQEENLNMDIRVTSE